MNKKLVFYLGYFLFPWGQAASRRVYGNAKSLIDAGYDVIVASGSPSPIKLEEYNPWGDPYNLSYIGLDTCPNQNHSTFKKISKLLFDSSKRIVGFLDSLSQKPDYIILYGAYTPYLIRLLPWCKKNSVPLIADVVEWYEPNSYRFGKLNPSYLNVDLSQKILFPQCDGIITISSFLDQYYRNKNCLTFKVPPTVDFEFFIQDFSIAKNNHLSLIYAGSPGAGKDLIKNLIDAILLINASGQKISLQLLGLTSEEIKKVCNFTSMPMAVQVLGKIPQQEVSTYVSKANFSLLLRKPLRNAQAGFPTKFVESMASGTPVIANITSDLGNYLFHNVNGLVCQDYSVESLVATLKDALNLPKEKILAMHVAAYNTAKKHFDYHIYSQGFSTFLDDVSHNYKLNREK